MRIALVACGDPATRIAQTDDADGGAEDGNSTHVTGCAPAEVADPALRERIHAAWDLARPAIAASLDTQALRQNPYPIYNAQLQTANLLFYADYHQDADLLESLAAVYDLAFDALTTTDVAFYYNAVDGDGVTIPKSVATLPAPTRMWVYPAETGFPIGREDVLSSAQFLYAVARVVRIGTEMHEPSPALRAFITRAVPILVHDHYLRWLVRAPNLPGAFQVKGWGCNDGTFDHREHIAHLLARRYGTDYFETYQSRSYCNAFTDRDLWIIAGIAEVLAAADLDDSALGLAENDLGTLREHVQNGVALTEARHDVRAVVLRDGTAATVAVFDPGTGDDHVDNQYAGFTGTSSACTACRSSCTDVCPEFPGWKSATNKTPRIAPVPATGLAWDISHARRLVAVYDSLHRHRDVLGTTFPTRDDIAELAREFGHVVWNGDEDAPYFTNRFNGNDGWYRVNYSARPAYGIAPGGFTKDAGRMGFGFWREFDADVGRAMDAMHGIDLESTDPANESTARSILIAVLPESAPYETRDGPCPWAE
ncbi:MAG: hypothetical protein KC417_11765 [Myxococcales bacterium]|nr:hypothetical protein [Myxococcales bacterium]